MSTLRPPRQTTPLWTSLVKYYRKCFEREVELGILVPADPNARVILPGLQEHLITHKATTTIISEPAHTQPILAYLNRRGRGIGGTFYYGYPLARDGDRLVLMSASPELYVPEIARRLGFDECICTRLRWNGDRLHGELDGENCRGDEKTRCFRLLRERHTGMRTVAYANGPSDLDHLELADRAVLVNGEAWTRVKASERGIQCADWR